MADQIIRPPGPRGRRFLRSPLLSGAGPLVNLPRIAAQYGDVAFWRFLHVSTYFFTHPDDIESVLVTRYPSFTKGLGARANPELFGNGLLTSEGDFWLRQRRLSQPAFHRTRIAAYADIMAREADRMLSTWRDGQQLDIHREMMQTTLAIATRTLFGVDLGPRMPIVAQAMDDFIRQNVGLSIWRLFFKVPTPSRRRFLQGVRALDEIVYGIIAERRAGDMGEDLLSDMLRAQDTDGSAMTDKQLRDEVMTMLLAGHETTALTLSWAWFPAGEPSRSTGQASRRSGPCTCGKTAGRSRRASTCLHEQSRTRVDAVVSSCMGYQPKVCRTGDHWCVHSCPPVPT